MNARLAARRLALLPKIEQEYFPFGGGLDLVTPPISLKPGVARSGAVNFECGVNGGYALIEGYERFSGKARPSDATYSILPCTVSGAWSTGDTITGVTSAATGVIIARALETYDARNVVGPILIKVEVM